MIRINMEMPESCDICPFMKTNDDLMSDDYRYMYCDYPYMGKYVSDYIASRHPDCPLHPLDEEIRVGDEVLNTVNGWKYVVTHIEPDDNFSVLHCPDGRATGVSKSNVERTGRHFDEVETLLQKMRGEHDETD